MVILVLHNYPHYIFFKTLGKSINIICEYVINLLTMWIVSG